MAGYDLNAIADALAAVWQGMASDTYDGVQDTVTAYSEVEGVVSIPAICIELDDVAWDITMARGADSLTFLAYLLVSSADSTSGQRLVRRMMSTGGSAGRVKDMLEHPSANTLGGLVSYARATGTRNIGTINYGGVDYLGAVIEIEVVAQ